ncbi:MAG: CHAD domain-containing protein [Cumulibacter sp.]
MSTSETREIERKYAVPDDAPVPSIASVDGVAAVVVRDAVLLDARYFDTPDLALLQHQITLRKRIGGGDEGWHLKLPGDGFRREIHHRITSSDVVPPELMVYLHAVLRGRDVIPVVQLTTSRTIHELRDADAALLAELCDDAVTSTPTIAAVPRAAWREWEVELHDGSAELLDDVEAILVHAGASTDVGPSKLARALGPALPASAPEPTWPRSPRIGDVARRYLVRESARLTDHDAGVRLHADDAIHQMRVAARRLRSVLSSYRSLFAGQDAQALRIELKALADSLGEARDSEVMLARLHALLDEQPADLVRGPVRERITQALTERYHQAHAQALVFMSSPRYYTLLNRLDGLRTVEFTDAAEVGASDGLAAVFDRDWKRVRRAARVAESTSGAAQEEALHDVRKAAKRLRYGLDSVSDVLGKPARRAAKAASAVTEILGDHNDSVITSEAIASLALEAHARGEDTFTYGRMQGIESSRASLSRDDYAAALHTLNGLRLEGWSRL